VLGVQEVGSPEALEDLRVRLDGAWENAVFGEPGERPIRVALLSRLPLLDVTRVRAFAAGIDPVKTDDDGTLTRAMSRGALHARIKAGATDVPLVVCATRACVRASRCGRRAAFQVRGDGARPRLASPGCVSPISCVVVTGSRPIRCWDMPLDASHDARIARNACAWPTVCRDARA
jgi:hypothetical protein